MGRSSRCFKFCCRILNFAADSTADKTNPRYLPTVKHNKKSCLQAGFFGSFFTFCTVRNIFLPQRSNAVIAAISSAIQSASMDFLRINMPIFFNLPNANSSKDTSHAFATFTKVSKLNFMAARSICEGRFHAGSLRQCSLQPLLAFPNFANPFSNYSIIYPHNTPQYLL